MTGCICITWWDFLLLFNSLLPFVLLRYAISIRQEAKRAGNWLKAYTIDTAASFVIDLNVGKLKPLVFIPELRLEFYLDGSWIVLMMYSERRKFRDLQTFSYIIRYRFLRLCQAAGLLCSDNINSHRQLTQSHSHNFQDV